MTKNKNRHRFGNLLGYVDILMNFLMCFTLLFVIALAMIHIESKKDDGLQVKTKLIIHLHWPDTAITDLDLWVRTQNPSNIVSFRQKDANNMWLDHDSMGAKSNTVLMADGSSKISAGNDEIVQFKECTNTQVVVNVHNYRPENDEFPMKATVEVIVPPSYNRVVTKEITLDGQKGQEITAFSFDLAEDCSITNIDQTTSIPFIYDILNKIPAIVPNSPPSQGSP